MRYLKIIVVTAYLLIVGTGLHGLPNFASILLCIYQFWKDISTLPHQHEINWQLGAIGIVAVLFLTVILFVNQYKHRYLLILSILGLAIIEIYFSGINNYYKITLWFVIPLLVFIASSALLTIKIFKKR